MIRINRQTDYAIRVVLALAKHPERKRISTTEIQQEMLIPPAFSPRIVAELSRGGFILTFPGRGPRARPPRRSNQPARTGGIFRGTDHHFRLHLGADAMSIRFQMSRTTPLGKTSSHDHS